MNSFTKYSSVALPRHFTLAAAFVSSAFTRLTLITLFTPHSVHSAGSCSHQWNFGNAQFAPPLRDPRGGSSVNKQLPATKLRPFLRNEYVRKMEISAFPQTNCFYWWIALIMNKFSGYVTPDGYNEHHYNTYISILQRELGNSISIYI